MLKQKNTLDQELNFLNKRIAEAEAEIDRKKAEQERKRQKEIEEQEKQEQVKQARLRPEKLECTLKELN